MLLLKARFQPISGTFFPREVPKGSGKKIEPEPFLWQFPRTPPDFRHDLAATHRRQLQIYLMIDAADGGQVPVSRPS